MNLEQKAKRNIKLYVFVKVFGKRVFLPLSAIYFVQVAGFSLAGIGLLGSLYFAINFIADVPTGIFADKVGKVASIKVGAIMNIASTLIYVTHPTKIGIILATIIEAAGYAFLIGAGEALTHDSLVIQKREKDYTKVVSRTQSISLIINTLLIATVPMTYKIDTRLPFFIGTIAYTCLLIVTLFMHEVSVPNKDKARNIIWPIISSPGMPMFALFYGIFGALYTAPSDVVNITFKQLGLHPSLLGWVFAAASLFAAPVGVYFHKLKKIDISKYIFIDIICLILSFIAIYIGSLKLLIIGFIVTMTMWRYRRALYQDRMLQKFPGRPKATLLSMMNNFEGINLIWLPAAVGFSVTRIGVSSAFGLLVLFGIFIGFGFMFFTTKLFGHSNNKKLRKA